ncbi:sensor histidine kinase [Pedobacter nutrimenti]|uniref:histidine kinase n=1 Tax=Pedobacter nutrimenti TaxID=1241337 RepID=A0A318UNH1_9SPHI|nr:HAMP domain-containing sensor histidine kinase [Pedobacter nutrimenti]PYF75615.1 HAMP domain-containing protein [Pedobacter nutrimenti]
MGVCCILTAISLKHSISSKDLLRHEASKLQQNLWNSEKLIGNFLAHKEEVEKAKKFHLNEDLALNFINTYRPKGINILTYQDKTLKFWSSYKITPPEVDQIKEGVSFIPLSNGWYEVIKKTTGAFSFIFYIDVKNQFLIENKYLRNEFSKELISSNALTLASFTDDQVYGIKSINGKLLFEVKLNSVSPRNIYSTIEVWLWVIGLFSFSLFFNAFCSWQAKKGRLVLSTLLLACFFLLIRITDLEYGWFNHQFNLDIFDPKIYAESFFLPSLGDFLLNVISITWLLLFIYTYKDKYTLPAWLSRSKVMGIALHLLLLVLLGGLAFMLDHVFSGLIYNSKINFDITNIVNLGWASWVGIVILCLVWFNLYLFCSVALLLSIKLNVSNKERLVLFLAAFAGYVIYRLTTDFTAFFIIYAFFIFILALNIYTQKHRFSIGIYALLFFSLALISSIKYVKYKDIKERNKRYRVAEEVQSTDNPRVISSIESLENGIASDHSVLNYFKAPALHKHVELEKLIDKKYLDSYLAQFEYSLYAFNSLDSTLNSDDAVHLVHYKDLVRSGSVKVSNFFYRLNDTFGYQSYFGIIPVFYNKHILGTLVLELKSQQYDYSNQFPDLLVDLKVKGDEDLKDYSFAFYNYGKLIKQAGKFTYKLNNQDFKGRKGEAIFVNDDRTGYNHMIYMPSSFKTVVVSKEKVSYVTRLAVLSFFFLVFIMFSILLYILIWVVKNIDDTWGGWFNINRSLMINANKILYKTRIQFSIVLSVVATLLIVGWTTFYYISSEYRRQQDDFIKDKLRKVQLSYEKMIHTNGIPSVSDQSNEEFNQFSDMNGAYLNLFDRQGNLLYTSIPKIYDYGFLGTKMGTKAFIYLSRMQLSEYLDPNEKIGDFSYSAAYAPIRNSQNQTVAYIGLPYYGNEGDYQSKIGVFINTLINIYALVFVAIGILAVFLANQITSPLTFIQDSIRKTKLGQKNQPILWSRHDEIGSLIKEYNKMIAALEESAIKLAKSERESAWREMAKQVAHEIKNPLTPLKLGVQLLEKAWKEKDANFEKKFDRFNKSFIEQIDSLATIASEFSNFAKMPDTKLQKLLLLPIIQQARDVFANTKDVEIGISDQTSLEVLIMGDKDQLLRTFNNLLKNAIEASGGQEACMVYIRIWNDQKKVWVEVADNGKGIDEYLHTKIFAPNFTTKSSGTGLGLAFVKQAVENAGGTVDFKSAVDTGTVFFLSFPLA